jgi:hypothetical protein
MAVVAESNHDSIPPSVDATPLAPADWTSALSDDRSAEPSSTTAPDTQDRRGSLAGHADMLAYRIMDLTLDDLRSCPHRRHHLSTNLMVSKMVV